MPIEDQNKPNPNWVNAPYEVHKWTLEKGYEHITEPPEVFKPRPRESNCATLEEMQAKKKFVKSY